MTKNFDDKDFDISCLRIFVFRFCQIILTAIAS